MLSASPRYHETTGGLEPVAAEIRPWWQSFDDPALDELVRDALAANFELRALQARIEQANALVRQAGGRLFPVMDASGDYESRWQSRVGSDGSNAAGRSGPTESSSIGALLDWELDVWGRLRTAKRAQQEEAQAVVQDWLAARLLLSASVAETYFELVEQRQQLRLLSEQIKVNETLLSLTRLRFGQGQSSVVDVLQQQEQAAATRALAPLVEARLAQLQYALDVLLGRAPGEREELAAGSAPEMPPLPRLGLPSDLLLERPDLAAVGHRVRAIDYGVWEAIAARLPRFSVGGAFVAVGDPGITALVQSAVASVTAPLFDAGIRKAEVDRRRARLDEVLAEYSDAYLSAVRDVETALVRERKQLERITLLENQLQTAQRLLSEARHRYSQGLTDYLPVLDALATEQNLQRELLTSRRFLLSIRVSLHRALGGPMAAGPNARENQKGRENQT